MKTGRLHFLKFMLLQWMTMEGAVTLPSVIGKDFGNSTSATWVGSKYHIECTMCSACDNPCATAPPTPTIPNFPPPPLPPHSSSGGSGYYNSPPSTPSTYYPPPPPGGGSYYKQPPPYPTGPTPPPPNPIVPYFPYYYHIPPPSATSAFGKVMVPWPLTAIALVFGSCLY